MPLSLNVGLSRKNSEDFNSAGVSINLTAELDQSLLARPQELQGAIEELYEQAEIALQRQGTGQPGTATPQNRSANTNGTRTQGRSSTSRPSGGGGTSGGGMTQSQRRAIDAIGDRLGLNVVEEARREHNLELDRMSVREASRFIDHLKSLQTSSSGDRR